MSLALCLAGCQGGERVDRGDAGSVPQERARAEASPLDEAISTLGYRLEWKGQPVFGSGGRVQFLDVFGDSIGVHDSTNLFTLMEKTTGANRWSNKLSASLTRHVGNVELDDGRLLVATETDIEIVSPETGEVEDRQNLAVLANTRPVVMDRIAVFGTTPGEVLGHNLVSGYKQWGYSMGRTTIEAAPVVVGSDVGVVAQNGRVLVLDPRDGSSRSSAKLFDGVEGEIAASERTLFISSLDQSIWAINAFNGSVVWRVRTSYPLVDTPVFHEGVLYAAIPERGFCAFDANTGSEMWCAEGVQGRAIAIQNRRVIVWRDGSASAVDAETGDVVVTVDVPGVSHIVSDGFVDGDLYVARPTGPVIKYSPR